jgi:cytochrome b
LPRAVILTLTKGCGTAARFTSTSGAAARARAHPVATVVIEATDQQRAGFRACGCVVVALVVDLGLHRVKGGLLAGEDVALEDDLADVEPIAQKMGERGRG